MDLDRLRKHYESLSDEALLDINRDELVAAACVLLDAEIAARGFNDPAEEEADTPAGSAPERRQGLHPERSEGFHVDENWLDDAATAFAVPVDHRSDRSEDMDRASAALEAAGIAHDVHVRAVEGGHELELLVPGKLILEATSILDRDVFNEQLEQGWRDHFAGLTDDELASVDVRMLTAGWADRIERLTRAYMEARRKRASHAPTI